MNDHLAAWIEYCRARINHEAAREAASQAYTSFKKAEHELVDALLEAELTGIPDACGATASLRQAFNIRCNQENTDLIEEWLLNTVGDAEPFKKTAIDKSAVTNHVKILCESGTPIDELPAFLEASSRPTITVRGWERKKSELLK